jgi:hypothetical protein
MPKVHPVRQRRAPARLREEDEEDDPQPGTSSEGQHWTRDEETLPPWWDTLMTSIDHKIQQAVANTQPATNQPSANRPATNQPADIPSQRQAEDALASFIRGPAVEALQGTANEVSAPNTSRSIKSLVPQHVKEKIWSREYVDMKVLLTNQTEKTDSFSLEIGSEGTTLQLLPQKKATPALTLLQWVRAWNRYVGILTEQAPQLGPVLSHHMDTVLSLAEKGAAWISYDENFRKMLVTGEAKWGSTHLEMYMKAHLETAACGPSAIQQPQTKADIPKGACFKYHTASACPNGARCTFQHKCFNCLGNHSFPNCRLTVQRPFKVLPKFQPQTPFRTGPTGQPGPRSGGREEPRSRGNRAF